jgi:hypothetical protein
MALFEPQNLLIRSEEFITSWSLAGTVTITKNISNAPNGSMTADSLNFQNSSSSISQSSVLATPTSSISLYTFSIYAKSSMNSKLILSISTNQSNSATRNIDVTSKWMRFSVSVSAGVGTTNIACKVQNIANGSSTSFDLWGAQLNPGTIQPYYKTTNAIYIGNSIGKISVPVVGDVKFNSSHKTIVEWDDGTATKSPYRTEFATTTKVSTGGFGTVVIDGVDLETRINNISLTSGLGESNITNASIVSNSIHLDKFDTLSMAKGGTNSTQFGKGEVLFSESSKMVSSPNFKIDSTGININNNLSVEMVMGTTVYTLKSEAGGLVLSTNVGGSPIINLTNNRGSPPTIISMVLSSSNLTYSVSDKDGDLRSIHIIWSSSQSKPVITQPSQILQYTLDPIFTPAINRIEIDLVRFPTTGTSIRNGTFTFPSPPTWFFAVVEDGPGNFSPIRAHP